jgi:allophanate hydrolase
LDIATLRRAYRDGTTAPDDVVADAIAAVGEETDPGIWIHVRPADEVVAEARRLREAHAGKALPPLYGLPFAVKDNIDVAGLPTTAACAEFGYVPERSSPVVDRLIAAGAICLGKTNLDQFATGLVGVRSPYGVPPNAFDPRFVTGGSSSGSAAALARGQVSFAVATDTAGSGRVPAAFNSLVGLKPSRGLFSLRGVVPACRSLDCVTLLTFTSGEAAEIAAICSAFDAEDPYSRREADRFSWTPRRPSGHIGRPRLGTPRESDLGPCDAPTRERFGAARAELEALGAELVAVDMAPFFEAGALLYDGPWIAERLSGLEAFVRDRTVAVLPVIRSILQGGAERRALDAFRGLHRLAALKRAVEAVWAKIDALVVPTAPLLPRIDEVERDPIGLNARLGKYTTFANLLDLAAVAVPGGVRSDGLPWGISFLGPWGSDPALLDLASAFEARVAAPLGATGWPAPPPLEQAADGLVGGRFAADGVSKRLKIAVVGAHLAGMPLNHQLTDLGGVLEARARTAAAYRLYALPGTVPPKPGLVRDSAGVRIAVEVWSLPIDNVGAFLSDVRSPLAIGSVELEDGTFVHGFLCEGHALAGAEDISGFGGWRAYVGAGDRGDHGDRRPGE